MWRQKSYVLKSCLNILKIVAEISRSRLSQESYTKYSLEKMSVEENIFNKISLDKHNNRNLSFFRKLTIYRSFCFYYFAKRIKWFLLKTLTQKCQLIYNRLYPPPSFSDQSLIVFVEKGVSCRWWLAKDTSNLKRCFYSSCNKSLLKA